MYRYQEDYEYKFLTLEKIRNVYFNNIVSLSLGRVKRFKFRK